MTDTPNPTDATATPGAEAGAAEADINQLLNEFDSASAPKQPTPSTTTPRTSAKTVVERLAPVIQFAEKTMAKEQKQEFEKGVSEAVAQVKAADELKALPEAFVRGYLFDHAERDPDFNKAFVERAQNPTAWKSQLEKARASAVEAMKGVPDQKVSETIAAARAAVAGDTSTVPADSDRLPNEKLNQMSDGEFARYKRELDARNRRR